MNAYEYLQKVAQEQVSLFTLVCTAYASVTIALLNDIGRQDLAAEVQKALISEIEARQAGLEPGNEAPDA